MLIGLTVGDCEGMAYRLTDDVFFEINVSPYRLQESYKAGVEISGLDVTEICSNYEDRRIPAPFFLRLKTLCPCADLVGWIEDELVANGDDEYQPTPEEFATIYMIIAQLGNPDIVFKRFDLETIDVGGFGVLADSEDC